MGENTHTFLRSWVPDSTTTIQSKKESEALVNIGELTEVPEITQEEVNIAELHVAMHSVKKAMLQLEDNQNFLHNRREKTEKEVEIMHARNEMIDAKLEIFNQDLKTTCRVVEKSVNAIADEAKLKDTLRICVLKKKTISMASFYTNWNELQKKLSDNPNIILVSSVGPMQVVEVKAPMHTQGAHDQLYEFYKEKGLLENVSIYRGKMNITTLKDRVITAGIKALNTACEIPKHNPKKNERNPVTIRWPDNDNRWAICLRKDGESHVMIAGITSWKSFQYQVYLNAEQMTENELDVVSSTMHGFESNDRVGLMFPICMEKFTNNDNLYNFSEWGRGAKGKGKGKSEGKGHSSQPPVGSGAASASTDGPGNAKTDAAHAGSR